MILRITQVQKVFLIEKVLQGKKELIKHIMKGNIISGKWQVDVSNIVADEIRDLCSEMLQLLGFDEYYELTEYGELLEELVDILYIG